MIYPIREDSNPQVNIDRGGSVLSDNILTTYNGHIEAYNGVYRHDAYIRIDGQKLLIIICF